MSVDTGVAEFMRTLVPPTGEVPSTITVSLDLQQADLDTSEFSPESVEQFGLIARERDTLGLEIAQDNLLAISDGLIEAISALDPPAPEYP